MASVAYFDPGNWSVDLQAGSEFGYRLLFVVLLASLGAVVLQALACKLGCVTGADLAMHCRLLFGNHPKHPKLVRATLLWPLYILCEIAIIATDLAELLGSAIGLCLLIGPKFPLWAGVVVTACDVLLVLTISKSKNGRPARVVEYIVVLLVLATFICFVVLIVKVSPDWPSVFEGYLPSSALVQHGAIYTSIGILGATVMPHALFLGSSLATLDRVAEDSSVPPSSSCCSTNSQYIKQTVKSLFGTESTDEEAVLAKRHSEWQNRSPTFILEHLKHGVVDMIASLLGFAMVINSAILVLAAAVFFRTRSSEDGEAPAGLFDAHDLITRTLGKPAGYIFAIALLCAGQSASLTATMAGQVVSEGFIQWRVSPFMRRLITRLLGLLPSAVVASVFGRRGIDSLLVGSQVALSFVLPFAVFPLVWLTSSPKIMKVKQEDGSYVDYSNSWYVRALGYLIFAVVVLANGYAIVSLAMGQGSA
ncbi:smf Mn2+ and Fe2+ transporter [Auricularia subglabra TFB-10046 SS5]|nr:smf Mn2+ and Fe2+ transporter [Auricularia subglabra TFB-10046 SS5]